MYRQTLVFRLLHLVVLNLGINLAQHLFALSRQWKLMKGKAEELTVLFFQKKIVVHQPVTS